MENKDKGKRRQELLNEIEDSLQTELEGCILDDINACLDQAFDDAKEIDFKLEEIRKVDRKKVMELITEILCNIQERDIAEALQNSIDDVE